MEITNHSFSPKGRLNCQKWIDEFGFDEVAKAVDIALSQYLKFDNENNPIKHTVDIVFDKIPGICANRKIAREKPYMADTQKMVGYANKKFRLSEYQEKEYKEHIGRLLYLFNEKATDYSKAFEDFFWKLKKSNDKSKTNTIPAIINTIVITATVPFIICFGVGQITFFNSALKFLKKLFLFFGSLAMTFPPMYLLHLFCFFMCYSFFAVFVNLLSRSHGLRYFSIL